MADQMVSKLGEAQGEAKWGTCAKYVDFFCFFFEIFGVFLCQHGWKLGAPQGIFWGEAKWGIPGTRRRFYKFRKNRNFWGPTLRYLKFTWVLPRV